MSEVRARLTVDVATGVEVRRSDAIYAVLAFVLDFLRLDRAKPLLQRGVRDNPWLTGLWIVSVDDDDDETVYQELVFRIDWDRHEVHLAEGRSSVVVPEGKGVVSTFSPELTRALRMFDEHRVRNGLSLAYYVSHRQDAKQDLKKALGLGTAAPLKYAGGRLEASLATGELDELGAEYRRYGSPEDTSKPAPNRIRSMIGHRW